MILSGGASSVTAYQNSLVLAVIAALLASALCGAFNGLLVAKLNIQPMVATLILYTAGRGIAQLIDRNTWKSYFTGTITESTDYGTDFCSFSSHIYDKTSQIAGAV